MSLWTWVLVWLSVAGFVLAAGSLVPVVTLALRLRKRIKELQNSPVFVSLESLEMQANRLSNTATKIEALAERANAALALIRASREASGVDEARKSLEAAGAGIHQLLEELR